MTAASASARSSDSRRSSDGIGAAADHDRQARLARRADVLALLAVVDGDDRHAALAQQQAQPQADLPEADDDHVVARAAPRARPSSPVSRRSIRRLTMPGREERLEDQRDQHQDRDERLEPARARRRPRRWGRR